MQIMKQLSLAVLALIVGMGFVPAATSLPSLVNTTTQILANRQGSASPIPASELQAAKGLAIINVTKAGLVIGGTLGEGVVLVRTKSGLSGMLGFDSWTAPIPIGLSGGSIGAQIGGSNTKAIVLLNSQQAVRVFTAPGKIGWDARASGTAGGDTNSQQTGGLLSDVDVKVYQETNGLYGGATIGGLSLSINDDAIKDAYGSQVYLRDILEGKVKAPDYVHPLINLANGNR